MAEETVQETGVVALGQRVVMPAASAAEAKQAWQEYEALKLSLLDKEHDVQIIGKEVFKKKSYWKKVSTFFNLNVEVREERKEAGPSGDPMDFTYHMTVRATAPNGRFLDAVGSCASYEKADWIATESRWGTEKKTWEKSASGKSFPKGTGVYEAAQPNTEHNVRSTAYTRASNRAISDLVGGGEVSAEEVDRKGSARTNDYDDGYDEPAAPVAKRTTKPAAAKKEPVEGAVVKSGDHDVNATTGEIVNEPDIFDQAANGDYPSDADVADMYALAEDKGYSRSSLENMISKRWNIEDVSQISRLQYDAVMAGLTKAAGR